MNADSRHPRYISNICVHQRLSAANNSFDPRSSAAKNSLEIDTQRNLTLARIVGLRRDTAKSGRRNVGRGWAEYHAIEDVEKLGPDGHSGPLLHANTPDQTEGF